MKKYEIMYIVKPSLDNDATEAEIAKLEKILTDNGATVTKTDKWGLRDLAYEIKDETKGYYVVIELDVPETANKALSEFQRLVSLDANVLRYLVTKAHAVAAQKQPAPETK